MRQYLLIIPLLLALFLFPQCKKNSFVYFNIRQQDQIIAFQPLDNYGEQELTAISKDISRFYGKKVIIFKPIAIPTTFFNAAINAYSGDSIVNLLSKLQNDTIGEIIGLTHYNIYTVKENKYKSYVDDAIFGMGYLPGNACVVSDIRLKTKEPSILNSRMRKVIIHEIGHNAGLPHCPDDNCIMSKRNGYVSNLDNGGNNYCSECENKLMR